MATSHVAVTAGSGTNLATHTISEDAATKHISRQNLVSAAGVDATGIAGTPSAVVQTVQGIPSMTPLLTTATVSGTVTANIGTGITKGAGTVDSTTTRVTIESGQLGALGQTTASASVSVTPASDRQNATLFSLAMTVDTAIFASGELIADSQQCNAFFNKTDGAGVINSLTVIDKDNEGAAFYVLVMRTSTSLGTENSAPSITGANLAAGLIGVIPVATADYISVGTATKVASIQNIGLPVKAVSGTDDLYIGIVNATGTPDYTAAGDLELVFGVLQD